MFYDDEEMYFREFIHVVHNELVHPNLEISPHGLRAIPTHTEDGIPIRKIYVTNLPPMTTRTELFGVFAQYGFIKSCWVRQGERGPKSSTYAFVTYTNAKDAHKALQAPVHEKILRGRTLKISPADSWHQPYEDAQGRVLWRRGDKITTIHETNDIPQSECVGESSTVEPQSQAQEEPSYTILETLNRDCLNHILSYIPIRDIIRSERVSKKWRDMVFDYLEGFRTFKTSWWQHGSVMLTTAVLRRVLQRLGGSLLRLHVDHRWSALNDRTAHIIGKFCPNLEELMIAGMNTKNWNPLLYGCKNLKSLMFMSCSKLTDSSLVHLVNSESCLESLKVSHNSHVTGLFLTSSDPRKLKRIAFYNCFCLQGTVLAAAMDCLPYLTALHLDLCPASMWKMMPEILGKLPKLEELSLSEYTSTDVSHDPAAGQAFCDAIGKLHDLKILNLSKNTFINNSVLKQVAQSCPRLQSLNVSSCNARRNFSNAGVGGVGDEGVSAVCVACTSLSRLDVSYLAALGDAGLAAAARARSLARLVTRGNPALGDAPLAACLAACHYLQELDACGCDLVTEEVVSAAARALEARPRALVLRLAGTAAAAAADLAARDKARWPPMSHKLLTVDVVDDRSEEQLRPDYVDHVFEDNSDDSIDDMYDHENFEDFLGSDDDFFLDEDLDDYEGIYAYGPNFILL